MAKEGIDNKASTISTEEVDLVERKQGFEGYVACVDPHPLRSESYQTELTPDILDSVALDTPIIKKRPFWRRCCSRICRCCCCCCRRSKCWGGCCCSCIDSLDD